MIYSSVVKSVIPKYTHRTIVRLFVFIVKKCMKFNCDYKHDVSLWVSLDVWQDVEYKNVRPT